MQTVFALFKSYPDADDAVRQLQESGFAAEEMNAIVHANTAKSYMKEEINLAQVHVDATDEIGDQELSGMALLVGNEQPVDVRGVGPVLAAGDMATILASSAMAQNQTGEDLESMLVSYGVSQETAHTYQSAIANGGVLLWMRSQTDHNSKVTPILQRHNGQHVFNN